MNKHKLISHLSILIIVIMSLQTFEMMFRSDSQTTALSMVLTVKTERPNYSPGEVVKISGALTYSNGTAIKGATIALEVKNPAGSTIFLDIVLSLDNGTYEDSFRLDKNALLGDYNVYVTARVNANPPVWNQTMFTVLTKLNVSIETKQPFYGPGENVEICGNITDTVGDPVQDAKIAIEVKDPRNNTIFLDIVFSSSEGKYEDSFRLDKDTPLGEYHVYVTANAAGYPTTGNQTTFTVLTMASLSETSSSESTLNETILVHQAIMNGVTVSGDLTGSLNFTNFEMVNITTGSFAGKGFSKGEWEAVVEGIPYAGNWEGMLFLKPSERKIYLKGAISGDISGIVEGHISETVNGSGIYDRYQATWKIGRLHTTIISATAYLNGAIIYQSYSEFPTTELYVLQTSIEGSATGHYNCSLSSTLTHVRILSNSPYSGEGFSIISFTSSYGIGEGWTHDRLVSIGIVEMNGLLTDPLYGIVHATMNETSVPRMLLIYIERVDIGLLPTSKLDLRTWGPQRISPGQTVTYAAEFRNDGLKSAENVTIVMSLPLTVTYSSNTGNGIYDSRYNEVIWTLGTIPAKSWGQVTATGTVAWGLSQNTILHPITSISTKVITVETDPSITMTDEILQATQNSIKMKIYLANESISGTLYIEAFLEPIIDAIEPTFEIIEEGDEVRIAYEFTMGGTPVEEVLGGNQKIWGTIKFLKWVKDLVNIVKDARDAIVAGKRREDMLQWARFEAPTRISEESYKYLSDWNIGKSVGEFLIPNVVKHIPVFGKAYYKITETIMQAMDRPFFIRSLHYRMMIEDPLNAPTTPEEMLEQYLEARSQRISSTKSQVVVARDPNIKYGAEGYVSPGQNLNYTIEYENEGEGIAFGVYITETLDEDLDDSTLAIGPVISKANGSLIAGPGTYNPSTRTITWLVGEVGPSEGGLANFTIKVRNDAPEGTEIINFATVYFPSVPETTRTNTIISVVGHPSIAIRNLTPLETAIARGSILYLNLTIANEGYLAEAFNVTIYANSTIIRTENITMSGKSENSLLFLWNTTDFAIGNYNISAYAWPISGETNTTDNLYVDGFVQIVPPIHDIAITNITFSKQYPAINETIQIYVTIENRGTLTETFDVSVNYTLLLDPLIGVQTITLNPGQSITLNFTWTPNATGRYEIKAYTSTIPDDVNSSDNTKIVYLYVSTTLTQTFSAEENSWMDMGIRGGRFYYGASPI
jgi:uncharacterized repeat protein (TIGR01451 family)